MSALNLFQDLGLLIVFVDARWIELRFVFTAYNMIVSCDFHGTKKLLMIYWWNIEKQERRKYRFENMQACLNYLAFKNPKYCQWKDDYLPFPNFWSTSYPVGFFHPVGVKLKDWNSMAGLILMFFMAVDLNSIVLKVIKFSGNGKNTIICSEDLFV